MDRTSPPGRASAQAYSHTGRPFPEIALDFAKAHPGTCQTQEQRIMLGGVCLERHQKAPELLPGEWLYLLMRRLALVEKTPDLGSGIAGKEPIIHGMAKHFPQGRKNISHARGCERLPLAY